MLRQDGESFEDGAGDQGLQWPSHQEHHVYSESSESSESQSSSESHGFDGSDDFDGSDAENLDGDDAQDYGSEEASEMPCFQRGRSFSMSRPQRIRDTYESDEHSKLRTAWALGQNAAAARLDVPEHVPLTVPDRNACQARNSLLTYRPLPLSHSSHSKHFGACGPGPVFAVQCCALPVLCVAGFLRWVETMR